MLFPNDQRTIEAFIIQADYIFYSIIINNDIIIYDFQEVQLLDILLEHEEDFEEFKNYIVQAAIQELGDAYGRFQVPTLDELFNDTTNEPLYWDPVVNFRKTHKQTDDSYEEQLFVINVYVESINLYLDVMNTRLVKNIVIAGFPGGGKTFVMMYIVIYVCSKGLTVIKASMMCH